MNKNLSAWRRIDRYRLLVQSGAFVLIFATPFLNYYFQFNFVQGWFQSLGIGKLWIVSPLEGLESILVSKLVYVPLLIGLIVPVLLALTLGRVFCSWICPISYLSELSDRILGFFSRKRRHVDRLLLPRRIFWFALVGELLLSMIMGAPIFVFLSPPGLVGREIMVAVFFHTLAIEGVVVLAVLAMNLVTRRFYCRYLCPLGAFLALLGARRRLKVLRDGSQCKECSMCDKVCPLGLSPMNDEGKGIYCWNCGQCIGSCANKALAFKWREM